MNTMKSYQIYHDCGKHISKYVDENGKIHYQINTKHSANVYNQYFDNIIAEDLILKDLNFHTFKCEELIEWMKKKKRNISKSLFNCLGWRFCSKLNNVWWKKVIVSKLKEKN